MKEILFLAHRIPYPPDKGDKIRSWHLLQGLARQFRVHLGTFVDDPHDWRYVEVLRRVCGEVCIRPLRPKAARIRSLSCLATGHALTVGYYRDKTLATWARRLAGEKDLSGVFVFSSSMAQYVTPLSLSPGTRRIVDLCDVDSDKWRQYARVAPWPGSWVYEREARLLADIEARCVKDFDATLVIAEPEAAMLHAIAPEAQQRIRVLPNGVDVERFDPAQSYANPFPDATSAVVFTGAMDYLPNIDGVDWFAKQLLPAIRAREPRAHFWIVGSNPAAEVRALVGVEGVTVTGRVPDIRPYLAHAAVVVAPLRIARGVQNKVLEGLAMAKPLVATPNAVQGIAGVTERELRAAESADDFIKSVVEALGRAPAVNSAAREFVRRNFAWQARLDAVIDLIQPGAGAPPRGERSGSAFGVARVAGAGT